MSSLREVNDAEFEDAVMKAKGPVLVDFWAPWCGPCRAIAPSLDAIAAERGDSLTIVKVNADQNEESMKRFGVRGIPALFLIVDGKIAGTKTGMASKTDLDKWIDETLAKPAALNVSVADHAAKAKVKTAEQEQAAKDAAKLVGNFMKRVYFGIAALQATGGTVVALSATSPAVTALGAAVAAYTAIRAGQVALSSPEKVKANRAVLLEKVAAQPHSIKLLAPGYLRGAFHTAGNIGVAATGVVLWGMAGETTGMAETIAMGTMGLGAAFKGALGTLSGVGRLWAQTRLPALAQKKAAEGPQI